MEKHIMVPNIIVYKNKTDLLTVFTIVIEADGHEMPYRCASIVLNQFGRGQWSGDLPGISRALTHSNCVYGGILWYDGKFYRNESINVDFSEPYRPLLSSTEQDVIDELTRRSTMVLNAFQTDSFLVR